MTRISDPASDSEEPPGSPEPVELLVVDDEEDVEALFRLRFRKELRRDELRLRFLSDPVAALNVIETDPDIEVVVTDLNMPGMNGLELIEHVDRLGRDLKTIVLTAYDDMANIRAAMMRGAFDFQVKPLQIDDLRATINKAVELVRALRAGDAAIQKASELDAHNQFIEEIFGRYVSHDVKTHLLASPEGFGRSERRMLTVLMADIRGFTTLADLLAPEYAVEMLNGYLETASEVILRRNGTINEILGDSLLVFFGAPLQDELAAEHAVAAAVELQLAMAELNDRHRSKDLPGLEIGIGIHTGEALVGTIGSRHRQKYAAVGKNVNLVSRIEGQTLGGQILVSEATRSAVGDSLETSGQVQLRLKGVADPVTVHEVRGLGAPYGLRLHRSRAQLVELSEPRAAVIYPISNERVGQAQEGEILATSPDASRVRCSVELEAGEEILLRDNGSERSARVTHDGRLGAKEFVAVYTSLPRPTRGAPWADP